MGTSVNEEQAPLESIGGGSEVEGYSSGPKYSALGGKRRKGRKGSRRTKKGNKMKKGKKGTRKGKKGPSKWIMHVKAFCKKTGKKFPEALKDPMCRKTFKH